MNVEIGMLNSIIINEAYDGVTIRTKEGKDLNICLRDYGFDMRIDKGQWFHVDSQEDICCVKCSRKSKLKKLEQ